MIKDIKFYETIVFDCDGVILNSNHLKTEAFRKAVIPYGIKASQDLVEYHILNGGVSRYKKFSYFLNNIVKEIDGYGIEILLERYADIVKTGLMNCEIASGIHQLRNTTKDSTWLVISGSDQTELRNIFNNRGLNKLFNGGIFGSPDDKETIIGRLQQKGMLLTKTLFIGDSEYDHLSATNMGLDFLYVSDWSEISDKNEFIEKYKLSTITKINQLLQ